MSIRTLAVTASTLAVMAMAGAAQANDYKHGRHYNEGRSYESNTVHKGQSAQVNRSHNYSKFENRERGKPESWNTMYPSERPITGSRLGAVVQKGNSATTQDMTHFSERRGETTFR